MQKTRRATAGHPEGELTENIKIDCSAIPNHIRDDLAAATLDGVMAFLRQPGGREFLDQKKAERKQQLEAAK